jgi:hypothetical protein
MFFVSKLTKAAKPPVGCLERAINACTRNALCHPERSTFGAPQMRHHLRGKRSEGSAVAPLEVCIPRQSRGLIVGGPSKGPILRTLIRLSTGGCAGGAWFISPALQRGGEDTICRPESRRDGAENCAFRFNSPRRCSMPTPGNVELLLPPRQSRGISPLE